MFRPLMTVLILSTLIMSCSELLVKTKEQNIVFVAKNYIKKVKTLDGGHCSSIFVNYKNKVRHITNAHCCKTPLVYEEKVVEFLKIDTVNDLCELGHNSLPSSGVNISYHTPEVTDNVHAIGFPGMYELTISDGKIVSGLYESPLNGQKLYRTTTFTIPGSSGGAAVDDNGDLLGVVSQTNGYSHGSFIPVKAVIEFLN